MAKTVIHVNKFIIGKNNKCNLDDAAIIVRRYNKRVNAKTAEVDGPVKIVHSQNKPLSGCGAKVWIETQAEVFVDGEKF